MADGPIQVVLNPQTFSEDRRTPNGGGGGKDFYRDRNDAFDQHRGELIQALNAIRQTRSGDARVNLLVTMRPDALAKSHRPFRSLFSPSRASHVGTASFGELIFALSPAAVTEVAATMTRAETEVMYRENAAGDLVYAPSPARSETSAIASIREWIPAEERGFTIEEAEAWLAESSTAKLTVEFFELPRRGTLRRSAVVQLTELRPWLRQQRELFSIERADPRGISADVVPQPRSDDLTLREAIAFVESSALVKRVRLEDALDPVDGYSGAPMPAPETAGKTHAELRPIVGVIDGGIDGPFKNSSTWVAGRAGLIAPDDRGLSLVNHGTQIASLIALGSSVNSGILRTDEDCRVYDLDLFPERTARASYYSSLEDFLGEVRASVERARTESNVRIFNLSYNLRNAPGGSPYSLAAEGLDRIATDLDVIFVISVGNLSAIDEREEWPPRATDALAMLARSRTDDRLMAPSDSINNVSVASVNPPNLLLGVEQAPTRYSRRGATIPSALKPDFAAYGGATPSSSKEKTGLFAFNAYGALTDVKGTSFAAPLVARYLASLESAISSDVSRELLIALATHNAAVPEALQDRRLSEIAASFVGRGLLPSVADTLDGSAHRISIVLSDTIAPRKCVEFPFTWPTSLVTDKGACRGKVKLTLVTQPVISPVHGWERVRINLDAALKQADETGTLSSKIEPTHEFFTGYTYANERALSSELGKWFPIKSYERTMPRGIGKSSDWRLDINYLTRAGVELPEEGIRFAAILTIEDPKEEAPIYEEMRASLSSIGVSLSDLRTSVRVGVSS